MTPYQKGSGLPNHCGMRERLRQAVRKARLPEISRMRISSGIAAEDVDVGDRQEPHRQEALAGKLAQQGEDQAPDQGQDGRDDGEFER